MIDELEEIFKECEHPFVTATANDNVLGNYCTKSYQDLDRLYSNMNRHDIPLDAICLKEIETDKIPDEKELSEKIEKLNKELGDIRNQYHSALVAKQAANYERLKLPKNERR